MNFKNFIIKIITGITAFCVMLPFIILGNGYNANFRWFEERNLEPLIPFSAFIAPLFVLYKLPESIAFTVTLAAKVAASVLEIFSSNKKSESEKLGVLEEKDRKPSDVLSTEIPPSDKEDGIVSTINQVVAHDPEHKKIKELDKNATASVTSQGENPHGIFHHNAQNSGEVSSAKTPEEHFQLTSSINHL
ncbi:hypothetical protein [Legionella impletisoli]|uniref:Transmembrane protein n=1 Tax=Legionella impletisoli TaxID=343510 RepID=A0A917JUW0_9GAMM|nr:hypothetical protein [Legionella impletisoli]GGI86143.1 hypothetical protein GCM10007966_13440 [Legionella impletisoli]